MTDKPTWEQIERERDEPVQIPLDPDVALRALLRVESELKPGAPSDKADRPDDCRSEP